MTEPIEFAKKWDDPLFLLASLPQLDQRYIGSYAKLVGEVIGNSKDSLALLEDIANLTLQATEVGTTITLSDAEIELHYVPNVHSSPRILSILCGASWDLWILHNSIRNLTSPVLNNRQEFLEAFVRLERISNIFHQAADINPYRFFRLLGNLGLDHIIPTFFAIERFNRDPNIGLTYVPEDTDIEIAQLLGFTLHEDRVGCDVNELLFDFIHQVMMNPNRFAGRLPVPDFELLKSLLSQVKPGTRRLKEAIEGKGVILEEQEEEKELLFRLYPDTRNLADILEEYDITQRHDEEMIGRCLELAEDARVQGEAEPIACVLVNTATGERIEKSHNVKSGRVYEHAEKLALLEAETLWGIQDIENWELYLSIQPCPGCMELILQCFPHIKSIVFSAYSSQGQYSQQMADDNIIRASAKQDDTPSGFFETRDGVRTGEGTSFYRDRLGWTQMIKPFDPKRQTYWQRKFTALLFRGE